MLLHVIKASFHLKAFL
uniref:Uncharacterized protein n=1 Tax=Arundo donax TaxID=35708 RepID=A0A0A9B9Y5_ARUDO